MNYVECAHIHDAKMKDDRNEQSKMQKQFTMQSERENC